MISRHIARSLGIVAVVVAGTSAVVVSQVVKPVLIGIQTDGSYLVSTNQRVQPFGTVQVIEGARPKDIALSPDGKTLATLAQGRVLLHDAQSGTLVKTISADAGPLGICWSPDGAMLFAAQGNGKITKITKSSDGTFQKADEAIAVDAPSSGGAGRGRRGGNNPQVAGLAVSPDGQQLYVALGIRNSIAVVKIADGTVERVIPVQAAPYQIALSPDGKTLAVANRGGAMAEENEKNAQDSAGTMVRVDKTTDAARSGSVSLMDTTTFAVTHIEAGRQPSGLAFSPMGGGANGSNLLYVACSDSDTIVTINVRDKRRINERGFLAKGDGGLFGQIPTDVAVSADGRLLFISCGGANSIALMDAVNGQILGRIPTGWYPIAVEQRAGGLYVASAKGYGSQARRGNGGSNVHGTFGVVQFVALSEATARIADLTKQVADNNRESIAALLPRKEVKPLPVPERVGEPSVFKHVVYIIKENLTYDGALGDLKDASGKPLGNGDPNLCTFGEAVTPNHHALAREFITLDNTYTSGTNSADGHQWTVSAVGNGYIEQNYGAHSRSYPYDGGDPLAYSPKGFLWTQAVKGGKSVRVYGEFVNRPVVRARDGGKRPTWTELWNDYKNKTNLFDIHPETDLAALRPHLHPRFIGFPSIVSDQWRADQFIADVDDWEAGRGKMPALSILLLPNDHTAGTNPNMPTPRATVADNDLALGRIVERLSKSKMWKETLILVIEDDSQNGVDHVDGHRTPAFAISPYTRRNGMVVSEMYNHTSFIRTMGLVLGLEAMNRFDGTATPLTMCFTPTANLAPYVAKPNQIPLDEMNPKPQTLRGEARRLALLSAKLDLSDVDRADSGIVARAIWYAQKPNVPFPAHLHKPERDSDDE